jgi:hypothetical protein
MPPAIRWPVNGKEMLLTARVIGTRLALCKLAAVQASRRR